MRYCRLPESGGTLTFHIDHIIPIKHDGEDHVDNLCFACYKCNGHKGYEIADLRSGGSSTNPFVPSVSNSGMLTSLCAKTWKSSDSPRKVAPPSVLLQMNDSERITNRQILAELGDYPCIFRGEASLASFDTPRLCRRQPARG
ncbi:MAG: HNH endonuclease [Chloroflexi bacterium]|uniref:HNH endonuclease n=1 Tax=Candidatus Flexifilum breve TaxID=3140694 RepID=UPI003135532F|nr:HNH endonuclease [Chloroflexota bacterium]